MSVAIGFSRYIVAAMSTCCALQNVGVPHVLARVRRWTVLFMVRLLVGLKRTTLSGLRKTDRRKA